MYIHKQLKFKTTPKTKTSRIMKTFLNRIYILKSDFYNTNNFLKMTNSIHSK